jgi:2-polyprenyl-3-methyl-5-hydroxy-6-metoxy-1,4-benzoquinol methylase
MFRIDSAQTMSADSQVTGSRACPLCQDRKALKLSDKSRSGATLHTVLCIGCGLVRSDPLPHDPVSFYSEHYRLEYKGTYRPKAKHVVRAGLVALDRRQKLAHLLNPGLRLLDIGSGGGEFAYLMQRSGLTVVGVEPNVGYAEYSAQTYGLTILKGFVQHQSLEADAFDLVTMWHVLEHTEDPPGILRFVCRALKPGGAIVIEVPNIFATCQSPRSTFHEAHLYNFSEQTLCLAAEMAGLSVESISYSADRGNVLVIARKPSAGDDMRGLPEREPQPYDRSALVAAIYNSVKSHTPIRHFFSGQPLLRLLGKLRRALREHQLTKQNKDEQLLQRVYQSSLGESGDTRIF